MSSRVPSHVLKFVATCAEASAKSTFGRYLPKAKLLSACRSTDGVKYQLKVPKNLCVEKGKGAAVLPVSATLCVFDEFSSYAVVTKDKTCRFGVSVHLAVEVLADIPAGSDVFVEVSAEKVGKTLGFIKMEMLDADRRLVAHGCHIKFLPMGPWWDLFAHPWVSPYSFPLIDWLSNNPAVANSWIGRRINDALLAGGNKALTGEGEAAESDAVGSTFRLLGVSPDAQAAAAAYSLRVRPALCNMVGQLHGGALAMAIESAATQHHAATSSSSSSSSSAFISKMEIQYLSAMKKEHRITCEPFTAAASGGGGSSVGRGRTVGSVYDVRSNNLCANYTCYWTAAA